MKLTPKSTLDSPEKRIAVIKNSHTRTEMRAVEQEFVNHEGPYLTLRQALDLAKAHHAVRKQLKRVVVIKNGHTDAELDEMEERWVNHQGPYLTLAEVIAIEKAKQDTHPDKP